MELNIYSVRDSIVNAYLTPLMAKNDGEAIRILENTVNNQAEGNNIAKHLADYQLYKLGTWNDANARYETHDPIRVISATELVKEKEITGVDIELIFNTLSDINKKLGD